MQQASGNGGLIMMHAENGIAIDVLVEQALAAGHTDPATTATSARSPWRPRPPTAPSSSPGSPDPLYVVHVSADEAVQEIAAARHKGLPVFGETCPQYLFLSTDNLAEPGFEGAKYVCSTPLRPKEHQETLWRGLRNNELQVVSTDHCPFCFSGQKEMGRGDFSKIPNGMPGVEHRMDLLHQAVVDGHITRRRWIEIACASPARMFGLYPKKGTIAPGADADIVIYDPEAEHTLSAETHHMNVDYSAYEGKRITGQVETVLSRGEVVIDGRKFTGRSGHGSYTPAPPVSTSTRRSRHGLRPRPPDGPARLRRRRPDAARRTQRVPLRLDLRLGGALAGAVRHLQPHPGAHGEADRGPDGHQPRHPHLGGHRLHLRHPERHVRQPHRLRHRARRLRDARRGPPAQHPGLPRRGHRRHPGLAEGREATVDGQPVQIPG